MMCHKEKRGDAPWHLMTCTFETCKPFVIKTLFNCGMRGYCFPSHAMASSTMTSDMLHHNMLFSKFCDLLASCVSRRCDDTLLSSIAACRHADHVRASAFQTCWGMEKKSFAYHPGTQHVLWLLRVMFPFEFG